MTIDFKYNLDALTRDSLMQPFIKTNLSEGYDIAHFDGLPLSILKQLIAEKFADPDETQNSSPSVQEFLDYMEEHPAATAHGYIVSKDRADYRVSIEGLEQETESIKCREDFFNFCRGADDLDPFSTPMHSWWD